MTVRVSIYTPKATHSERNHFSKPGKNTDFKGDYDSIVLLVQNVNLRSFVRQEMLVLPSCLQTINSAVFSNCGGRGQSPNRLCINCSLDILLELIYTNV